MQIYKYFLQIQKKKKKHRDDWHDDHKEVWGPGQKTNRWGPGGPPQVADVRAEMKRIALLTPEERSRETLRARHAAAVGGINEHIDFHHDYKVPKPELDEMGVDWAGPPYRKHFDTNWTGGKDEQPSPTCPPGERCHHHTHNINPKTGEQTITAQWAKTHSTNPKTGRMERSATRSATHNLMYPSKKSWKEWLTVRKGRWEGEEKKRAEEAEREEWNATGRVRGKKPQCEMKDESPGASGKQCKARATFRNRVGMGMRKDTPHDKLFFQTAYFCPECQKKFDRAVEQQKRGIDTFSIDEDGNTAIDPR